MQNFIVNIDSTKKYFVNSVNQRMINKCVIDCAETEQFKFSFVDKCGTPVELKENMQYYLAVSKERNNAGTILIFDDNPVIDGNSIIFNLNSKTEEYLSIIKNKTECWIEIGEKQFGADNYNILLQDNCICLPKVYVIGVPTELESYYTKTESDALFATKEQLNNDYYTKTESEERFLDKSEVLNDFYTKDETNSTFATKAELPTKVSELENDSGFISSYTETDPIFTSVSATLATKAELNTKADKAELPTKVSELQNDSGFISSYTETDPIFTSISATLATKAELFSGSYNDLTDVPTDITKQGNTFNTGNNLVKLVDGKLPTLDGSNLTNISVDLSEYAKIEDIQRIFYVEELPSVSAAIANSLYVLKTTKETKLFDGNEFVSISYDTVTDFLMPDNDSVPTTLAVSSFVENKIANIDIPSGSLPSAYVSDIDSCVGSVYTVDYNDILSYTRGGTPSQRVINWNFNNLKNNLSVPEYTYSSQYIYLNANDTIDYSNTINTLTLGGYYELNTVNYSSNRFTFNDIKMFKIYNPNGYTFKFGYLDYDSNNTFGEYDENNQRWEKELITSTDTGVTTFLIYKAQHQSGNAVMMLNYNGKEWPLWYA